ncbi:hypothetical protein K438DRAFT_1776840 [Mycena galopus ATCC 62051]|nr:hypothetical protein K438DRAFT_1776840 [Mycena galopus ATCC 62051]
MAPSKHLQSSRARSFRRGRLSFGFQSLSAPAASRPGPPAFGLQSCSASAASRSERIGVGLQPSAPHQHPGQVPPPSGSNHPPPQQPPSQNASASGSNHPPPHQHPGQAPPPSGSNHPPPQQHPGQNTSASGSPPQQHPGQGAGGPRSPPATAGRKRKAPHMRSQRNASAKKKRAGPTSWKIPRRGVPEAAAGLQRAIFICAFSWASFLNLPWRASHPDAMAPFEARFRSAEDIGAQLADILAAAIPPSNAIYERVAAFLRSAKASGSQTAADAGKVGDDNLRSIFNCVANTGLHSFMPDVFGNPESMYNLAHEHVPSTLSAASSCDMGTRTLSCQPVAYPRDHLIQRFYRSFIYGHMKEQAGKEERRPGQLETDIVLNNIYRRRTEPGRDDAVSALFDVITERRQWPWHEKAGRDHGNSHSLLQLQYAYRFAQGPRTRRRELPPSDLSHALPTRVPIDYFSPDFFNALSVRDRASYMHNGIALPTKEHCRTWKDILAWKGLSTADFMTRYGTAKRTLYNLPTDEEIALLSDDEDEDDEMADGDD